MLKTTMIALASGAFALAACHGNENPPAQSPPIGRSTTTTSVDNMWPPPAPAPAAPVMVDRSTLGTPPLPDAGATATRSGVDTPIGTYTRDPSPDFEVTEESDGTASPTRNADNTKTNERDRHGTLTPMNQGNSANETKITAAIRKGLMSDGSLSFNAKNAKVITTGSKVTLRGPVKSAQEKATIENLAKQTAGVTQVDSQLEIKK